MTYSGPVWCDEKSPISWRMAAVLSLLASVMALRISPEFSGMNAAISLGAAVMSVMLPAARFRGSLCFLVAVFFGLWLSPLSGLSPEHMRFVLGTAFLVFSLVYQGPLPLYFAALLLSGGLLAPQLSLDLKGLTVGAILLEDSFQFLQAGAALGTAVLFIRISRTRTLDLHSALHLASESLEKTRARVGAANDLVSMTREKFLGNAHGRGEVSPSEPQPQIEPLATYTCSFDEIIAALRKCFADFQLEGRARGRIAGPIRFVFFAPVAGYDEKSIISVDKQSLIAGVDACLQLALESLPEIGARKREGVVRLSIRYGLRVVEISIEDNGRGLIARNPANEDKLSSLKELTGAWGGSFDRVSRLGVGSRTSLELRILRERGRVHRATLKHPVTAPSQSVGVPLA